MSLAIRLLDFEAAHERHTGAKEDAIRTELDLPVARYYQLLHKTIDTPEAIRHNPMLCARIRQRITRHRRP